MHWRSDGVRDMDAGEIEIFALVGRNIINFAVGGGGFCLSTQHYENVWCL